MAALSLFQDSRMTGAAGGQWSQDIGGGLKYLFEENSGMLAVIPEPSAALLGSLGMLALLRRRRA